LPPLPELELCQQTGAPGGAEPGEAVGPCSHSVGSGQKASAQGEET